MVEVGLLQHTIEVLGGPAAKNLTAQDFSHYRARRLKKIKLQIMSRLICLVFLMNLKDLKKSIMEIH